MAVLASCFRLSFLSACNCIKANEFHADRRYAGLGNHAPPLCGESSIQDLPLGWPLARARIALWLLGGKMMRFFGPCVRSLAARLDRLRGAALLARRDMNIDDANAA